MYKYTCEYCNKQYIPKRRGVQKFCSSSCRSRNHQVKQKLEKSEIEKKEITSSDQNNKKPGINLPDIGNSAIGYAAYDGLKSFLTSSENKPATKKDIQDLIIANQKKSFLIQNVPKTPDGKSAFFDLKTQNLFYSYIKK